MVLLQVIVFVSQKSQDGLENAKIRYLNKNIHLLKLKMECKPFFNTVLVLCQEGSCNMINMFLS